MRKILLILFVNLSLISQAQILYTHLQIPYSSSNVTEKDKHGFFVAQRVKGKLSGTGLYKYKNGTLYIGDFKDKKPNGFGMLICSEEDTVANCPNSKIYVGKFKDGLKRGKGVCYNSNGEMIYRGRFENDMPLSEFTTMNDSRYFSDAKTDELYYIGEFEGATPNGFGSIFFTNGDILISKFKDGQRIGINIYLEHDGNWTSENVEDGNSILISSSREYASYVEGSKSEWNASWKEVLGSLSDWTAALNELSLKLESISQSSNYNSSEVFQDYDSSEIQIDKKGSSISDDKYNLSEQRVYNQDKSTYFKYDGMLSQVFAGNRNASRNEIKSWQNKMKQLRQKWEAKGKKFPHVANEDK